MLISYEEFTSSTAAAERFMLQPKAMSVLYSCARFRDLIASADAHENIPPLGQDHLVIQVFPEGHGVGQ
jgi:hypothetical protein